MPTGEQILSQVIAGAIVLAIFTFVGWAFNSLSDDRNYERDYVPYSLPEMDYVLSETPSSPVVSSSPTQIIIIQQQLPQQTQVQTNPVAGIHPQVVSEPPVRDNSISDPEICDEPSNIPIPKHNVGGYQLITQQFHNKSAGRIL